MSVQTADTRHAALLDRYGPEGAPEGAGPWNPVIDLLLRHRSVRAYRADPPPPGTLETLVAAAQSAASSSNMQAWSVVSVTDPAVRARLAEVAGQQRHIEQCPLFLVWVADLSRHARVAAGSGAPLEGLPFLETFLVAALDAAMAAQNAVVAAESMGLSTVYIGALRNDVGAVAQALGLPPGAVGVMGLCVGYEAAQDPPVQVKPRLPQSSVLHHGRYTTDDAASRESYDRALEAFSRVSERSAYTWTQRVRARLANVASLNGRDRLHAALNRLGFPLQ